MLVEHKTCNDTELRRDDAGQAALQGGRVYGRVDANWGGGEVGREEDTELVRSSRFRKCSSNTRRAMRWNQRQKNETGRLGRASNTHSIVAEDKVKAEAEAEAEWVIESGS